MRLLPHVSSPRIVTTPTPHLAPTKHAKPGDNRLAIVVANLLANQMHWDIFDDVKGELMNRKWHDGNIRRDAWCLQSGLIGPVRILGLRKITLQAQTQ